MRKTTIALLIAIPILCISAVGIYNLPFVNEKLAWRIDGLKADIIYALNPPEEVVFVPVGGGTEPPLLSPTPTNTLPPTATIALTTPIPTETSPPSPTPTLSPTPLPPEHQLSGILHQYQMWNNCGPANLSMALSFWGWKGDQRDTAAFLKPNQRDKNVMPYEMEDYVEQETDLEAVVRVGGELDTLKAFVSSGIPVITEKGFEGVSFEGWMGHYQVVYGFDDARGGFVVQDSYKGPGQFISYEDFLNDWRAFNYTYIVPYPADLRQKVLDILGLQVYDKVNYAFAAQKALDETQTLNDRDLYFAWFNRGTNLVLMNDYSGAAQAYDTAFANYASIPTEQRPWRNMWYQTGPYFAYYFSGRYQDVIDLATSTLEAMAEPILEESYYWRARAKLALGNVDEAVDDLRTCLEVHEGFQPCVGELENLGLEP